MSLDRLKVQIRELRALDRQGVYALVADARYQLVHKRLRTRF
jgi:hypothetical protein